MLSESGCAWKEEEEAEISAGLSLTCVILHSLMLAGVALGHPFPGSRGKPVLLVHLRQAQQALGEQIGDNGPTSRWLGWTERVSLCAGFAGRSCSAPS